MRHVLKGATALFGTGVRLEEVFTYTQAEAIKRFAELLEIYIAQHDVTLLVARKAVCFVRALQKNGYLPKELPGFYCSSRAASFPKLRKSDGATILSGRIALVDEVGITLNTIKNIQAKLMQTNLEAEPDILLGAACKDSDLIDGMLGNNVRVVERMDETEILEFARSISRYIQLSGLTSNSDQPIFEVPLAGRELGAVLHDLNASDITTDAQKERGYQCLTVTYDARQWLSRLHLEPKASLVKIRIYIDKNEDKLSIVPFVIPGPMFADAVTFAFDSICDESLRDEIPAGGRDATEARLRICLFSLACDLGRFALRGMIGDDVASASNPAVMCFRGFDMGRLKHKEPAESEMTPLDSVDTDMLGLAVGSVRTSVLKSEKHHGERHLAAAEISAESGYECEEDNCVGPVASVVIDRLVDDGLMVPCPTLGDEGAYVRCFRSGEVSRLTRKQLAGLGRNLNKLNLGEERKTEYKDAVNRVGVLFGRYLDADDADGRRRRTASVADPLVFSYLGEAAIANGIKMPELNLAEVVQFVTSSDDGDSSPYDDHASKFVCALKKLGELCAGDDGSPFKDGNMSVALDLLNELIEADERVGFTEARIAYTTGFHWVKLAASDNDMRVPTKVSEKMSALATELNRGRERTRRLDVDWLAKQQLDENDDYICFLKESYVRILAPKRDDIVVDLRNNAIRCLEYMANGTGQPSVEDEKTLAKLEIINTALIQGRIPQLEEADIGSMTKLAGSNCIKVCVKEGAHIEGTLFESPVVREGAEGCVLYFPQEGARLTYIAPNLEAAMPQVSGRSSDLETIYPCVARETIVEMLQDGVRHGQHAVIRLVCEPDWQGLEDARRKVEKELAKSASKVEALSWDEGQKVAFPELLTASNEVFVTACKLCKKEAAVVVEADELYYGSGARVDNSISIANSSLGGGVNQGINNTQSGRDSVTGKGAVGGNDTTAATGDGAVVNKGDASDAFSAKDVIQLATDLGNLCEDKAVERLGSIMSLLNDFKNDVSGADKEPEDNKKRLLDRAADSLGMIKNLLKNCVATTSLVKQLSEAFSKLCSQ